MALLLGDTFDFGIAIVFAALDAQHPIFYYYYSVIYYLFLTESTKFKCFRFSIINIKVKRKVNKNR